MGCSFIAFMGTLEISLINDIAEGIIAQSVAK